MISTSSIEQALKAFLTTQLGAVEIDHGEKENKITFLAFTVAGKPVGLRCFTGDVAIPEIMPACIVKCVESNKMSGTSLTRAKVEIAFAMPRSVEGFTDTLHRAIQAAVMAELVTDNLEVISTATQAAGAGICGGWADKGSVDQHTKGWWRTIHTLSPFGLREV